MTENQKVSGKNGRPCKTPTSGNFVDYKDYKPPRTPTLLRTPHAGYICVSQQLTRKSNFLLDLLPPPRQQYFLKVATQHIQMTGASAEKHFVKRKIGPEKVEKVTSGQLFDATDKSSHSSHDQPFSPAGHRAAWSNRKPVAIVDMAHRHCQSRSCSGHAGSPWDERKLITLIARVGVARV